jgi:ribosome-binding factor A
MSKRTHRLGARPSRAAQAHPYPGAPDAGAAGHRQERLERILHEEIQTLLRDEAADPALHAVRLVSVHLSVDGGQARLGYVVTASLSAERRVERTSRDALARATGFLRARLAALLDLKRLPRLSFTFVGVREPATPSAGGEPWPD